MALLMILFQTTLCYGQSSSDGQTIHNSDFNWTISIPRGFDKVADSAWTKMQNKGAAAIESTYDEKVENQAKTIFVFQSDQLNYFESNYQPFDSTKDGNYLEVYKNVNDILYGTLKAQMPMAKLDSSYSRETVGGKDFSVFHLTAVITQQVTLHILMYSRLFGKKEFTVNIMYADPAKGTAILDAWRSSTFEKVLK
jgi:hypothetical protein